MSENDYMSRVDRFEFFLEPNDKLVINFENHVVLKIDYIDIDKDETLFFLKFCAF